MKEWLDHLEEQIHQLLIAGISTPGAIEALRPLAEQLSAAGMKNLARRVEAILEAANIEQQISALFRCLEMIRQARWLLIRPQQVDPLALYPLQGVSHLLLHPGQGPPVSREFLEDLQRPLSVRLSAFVHLIAGKSLPELEPLRIYLCHGDYTDLMGRQLVAFGREAVPMLKDLLGWKNRMARRRACELLGEIGDEEALRALVEMLGSDLSRVAGTALARNGPKALSALLAGLQHPDPQVQIRSAKWLGELEMAEAVPSLQERLRKAPKKIKPFLELALVRLRAKPIELATRYLREAEDHSLRIEAKRVLIRLGRIPLESLVEELEGRSPKAQMLAGEVIAEFPEADQRRALAPLLERAQAGRLPDRKKALEKLALVPSPALYEFIRAAQHGDVLSAYAATMEDHRLIPDLMEIVVLSEEAFGKIGDMRTLTRLLHAWEVEIRAWGTGRKAERSLIMMGEPAIEPLRARRSHPDARIAEAAKKALRQIVVDLMQHTVRHRPAKTLRQSPSPRAARRR
ncbi:HEAT repeat domain-containing protein [Thermoflexus sp.]|uniref:HEAT repeat domain-containing protein n=1 Tax=Thermoflexus sp. TaxID=1969742 RepID=UPI002ADD31D6|nr:HEAT repeat domain-containing protein [Thermoflexus sp.]